MSLSYDLAAPLAASQRGGDVRLHDLALGLDVRGPHVFATTTDAVLTNGLLRVAIGPTTGAPSVTLTAYRGTVSTDDAIADSLSDTLGGTPAAGTWVAMGTVTLDSPAVSAHLRAVEVLSVSSEAAAVRLDAGAVGDIYLTLVRGEPMVRIQHGRQRGSLVSTTRRVSWSAGPTMEASAGRVSEADPPASATQFRFLAALGAATADAGARSLTTASVSTAHFAAGVGSGEPHTTPSALHHQLAGISDRRIQAVTA